MNGLLTRILSQVAILATEVMGATAMDHMGSQPRTHQMGDLTALAKVLAQMSGMRATDDA